MTPQPNIDQGLKAASEKLRGILEKRKKGKALSGNEEIFLEQAQSQKSRKVSSLKAAASALKAEGIESATVSTVKALAAEFPDAVDSHGRVTITEEMISWVRERVNSSPIPDKETLQCCKLIVEVKCILFNAEKEQDLYVAKADHDAWVSETRAQVEIILKKKLKNELPPKLEGLRAPEMAAKMDEVIAPLVKLLRFCRHETAETE